jgi:hypothetical protein
MLRNERSTLQFAGTCSPHDECTEEAKKTGKTKKPLQTSTLPTSTQFLSSAHNHRLHLFNTVFASLANTGRLLTLFSHNFCSSAVESKEQTSKTSKHYLEQEPTTNKNQRPTTNKQGINYDTSPEFHRMQVPHYSFGCSCS